MVKVSRTGVGLDVNDLKLAGLLGASVLAIFLWSKGYQKTASAFAGMAAVLGVEVVI